MRRRMLVARSEAGQPSLRALLCMIFNVLSA
jgi:hypothetical protein